jgi:hypothetical protein
MMERRHQIVHRADKVRVAAANTNAYSLQPIEAIEVLLWLRATINFMQSLLQPMFLKQTPLDELAKKLGIRINKAEKA